MRREWFKYPPIYYVAFVLLSLCFLSVAFGADQRNIFVVWDEFVKDSNDANTRMVDVEAYFKNCLQKNVSPETVYDIHTVENLEKASREFREVADKLDEMRRRIEYPIPKGTVTAKR